MADLGLSGLASGFDWRALVDQLVDVERTSQKRLATEQISIERRNNAYGSVVTQLGVLRNKVNALQDPDLFGARSATSSDSDLATVSAGVGTPVGAYALSVSQLATAAVRRGSSDIAQTLSATADLSGVSVSSAPLGTAITAGTFTVNGQQVTVAATDSLQNVLDQISAATAGDVSASYDPGTDRITLSSTGEIVLGAATDSSNFLQAVKLRNNGTGSVTSSSNLGSVRLGSALASANLASPVTAGTFAINGVTLTVAADDTLLDVLNTINASQAGVTASYDSVNDRFLLTNDTTGDIGIALAEGTSNFLSASGLTTGTLQRRNDLLYTVNGGGQLVSHSNTIDADSSGIEGLSITALDVGSVTVTVGSDVDRIKAAISGFVDEFNRVQALIDTNVSSTTDANGKVKAGVLAGESDANDVASTLRRLANASLTGLSGTLNRLERIGINSNGSDNNLAIGDEEALEDAITNNLDDLEELFTHSTLGLATKLETYLEATVDDEGTLVEHQNRLDAQSAGIDDQISNQERLVQSYRDRLVASFVAMETAQARINQQIQYLSQRFGSSSR